MRVAVTGSSGLIGAAVVADLAAAGHQVLRLVRRPPTGAAEIRWDPHAAGPGLEPAALSGADAVIHLAGAPIGIGRWTTARKAEFRDSRVRGTTALVAAIVAAANPPPVLLSGSAVGWYGDTGDHTVDESAPAGQGFMADVVRDWEAAAQRAGSAGTRVVNLRTGIVLVRGGGILARMLPLFRLGLGARLGTGRQFLSWITLADEVRAIRFLLPHAIDGPVNLTAPVPVTNAEFTAELGRVLGRPAVLRVPAPALRAGLGEFSGELLSGARVVPGRLREAGFEFSYPELRPALAAVLNPGLPAA